jgi:hypothetical protein
MSKRIDREAVVDLMLSAGTLEECKLAGQVAERWIAEHPEDADYIRLAGESLEMKRLALEEGEGV